MKSGMEGKMVKRMLLMLAVVGLVFGGIFGYKAFQGYMMHKAMSSQQMPPATVTAMKAEYQPWQAQIKSVGSLRAVRGVDVTSEITGLVRTLNFKSGDEVKAEQVLVQLNADADIALLHSLEAAADLAQTVYDRDKKQFTVQAVSQSTLDTDAADLKSKRAQVEAQAAIVDKKTIRAPFAGHLGISTVNPGQYINPGDKIVTLQTLDPIYADFYLPQQKLSLVKPGQTILVTTDTYPGTVFRGRITAISPRVETDSRNFQIEATVANPRHLLLPGTYVNVEVQAEEVRQFLTLPQTAVTFNPYGETVFVAESGKPGPDGKPTLIAKQRFVTANGTRGDQVAILKGINPGELVVTSGQLKLKSGSPIVINNKIQPTNEIAPNPTEE